MLPNGSIVRGFKKALIALCPLGISNNGMKLNIYPLRGAFDHKNTKGRTLKETSPATTVVMQKMLTF